MKKVGQKIVTVEDPFIDYEGVTSLVQLVETSNTTISFDKVLDYEFINLSNVPVLLSNGVFLDRYYTGAIASPTIIAGSFNRWKPLLKANERDTGQYSASFLDTFYAAVTPVRRLYVIKKIYKPAVVKSQF